MSFGIAVYLKFKFKSNATTISKQINSIVKRLIAKDFLYKISGGEFRQNIVNCTGKPNKLATIYVFIYFCIAFESWYETQSI